MFASQPGVGGKQLLTWFRPGTLSPPLSCSCLPGHCPGGKAGVWGGREGGGGVADALYSWDFRFKLLKAAISSTMRVFLSSSYIPHPWSTLLKTFLTDIIIFRPRKDLDIRGSFDCGLIEVFRIFSGSNLSDIGWHYWANKRLLYMAKIGLKGSRLRRISR